MLRVHSAQMALLKCTIINEKFLKCTLEKKCEKSAGLIVICATSFYGSTQENIISERCLVRDMFSILSSVTILKFPIKNTDFISKYIDHSCDEEEKNLNLLLDVPKTHTFSN